MGDQVNFSYESRLYVTETIRDLYPTKNCQHGSNVATFTY